MSVINELKKQNTYRLIANLIFYVPMGCLFAYGAFYKFGGFAELRMSFCLYLSLAIAALGYSFYLVIRHITKGYLRSYNESLSLYGVSEATVESDFSDSEPYHQVLFGRRNLLYAGKKPFLIPYDNILWCYIRFRNVKNEIPTCYLYVFDDKGSKWVMKFTDRSYVQDILYTIKENAPAAYYGDSKEYFTLHESYFEEMVANVKKKKEF